MKGTKFYRTWESIKNRCRNKSQTNYYRYGGRGITFIDSWDIFLNFKDDMYKSYLKHSIKHGESNTTLDRIDNNADYSKENCRWVTKSEQQSNTSRSHRITINGKTKSVIEWSKVYGIKPATIRQRIVEYGWSPELAVTKPKYFVFNKKDTISKLKAIKELL